MNPLKLRLFTGEIIEMHRTPRGAFVCPVCAYEYDASLGPPYEAGGDPDEEGVQSGFARFDWICPDCNTQYGEDDAPSLDGSPPMAEQWEQLRLAWLQETGWPEEVLKRLHDYLGIDVVALRERLARARGLPPSS